MHTGRVVRVGGVYWLTERSGSGRRTGWIIKVRNLGDNPFQEISGELFCTTTGNVLDTRNSFPVFAYEIQDEISEEEYIKMRDILIKEMMIFG